LIKAEAIIASTNNDLLNLTIINTTKKLNPKIYTIARENSLEDLTIFQAANIDRVYVLEKILPNIPTPLFPNLYKRLYTESLSKYRIKWSLNPNCHLKSS